MTTAKFEKGIIIKRKICTLTDFMGNYADDKFVHLHVKDHYGNSRGSIVKTYALGSDIYNAMIYGECNKISDYYGAFLQACRDMIQARIDELQKEFDNL